MNNYLEFESDIKGLEEQLDKLKNPFNNEGLEKVDTEKINQIQNELDQKVKKVYSNLNRWQKTLLSRHENRPRAGWLIDNLFSNFVKLSGDRQSEDDLAVLAGFAVFDENQSVLVLAMDKGDDLNSRIEKKFGMVSPSGYLKSQRLMRLADKFNIPIISFIDCPGASPTVKSEEQGQAHAISKTIECSMNLGVPNIAIIVGEGGSGGALALASSNKVLMAQNSVYSVISPEGASSILWRDPKKSPEAAEAMKLTAQDLLELGIIDEVIEELVPAHRDKNTLLNEIKKSIRKNLKELSNLSRDNILNHRKQKFLSIGRKEGFKMNIERPDKMTLDERNLFKFKQKFFSNKFSIPILICFLVILLSLILFYL